MKGVFLGRRSLKQTSNLDCVASSLEKLLVGPFSEGFPTSCFADSQLRSISFRVDGAALWYCVASKGDRAEQRSAWPLPLRSDEFSDGILGLQEHDAHRVQRQTSSISS